MADSGENTVDPFRTWHPKFLRDIQANADHWRDYGAIIDRSVERTIHTDQQIRLAIEHRVADFCLQPTVKPADWKAQARELEAREAIVDQALTAYSKPWPIPLAAIHLNRQARQFVPALKAHRETLTRTLATTRDCAASPQSPLDRNDEALVALVVCLEWLTNQKCWAICAKLVNHGLSAAGHRNASYSADLFRHLMPRYEEQNPSGYSDWCHYFESHIHFREGVERPPVPPSPDSEIPPDLEQPEPEDPEF